MSIAFDAVSSNLGGSGTNVTVSHTCTGKYLILLAGIQVYYVGNDATSVVSSVTYNGVSMTLISKTNVGGDNTQASYLYYLINPSTGSNTLSVSTSTSVTGLQVQGASYTGVNQSGQPDSYNTGNTSSPLTISTTTVANNCWLVGTAASSSGATLNAGTGTTLRSLAGRQVAFDSNGAKSPAGSYSLQCTSSTPLGGVIASIAPFVYTLNCSTGYEPPMAMRS